MKNATNAGTEVPGQFFTGQAVKQAVVSSASKQASLTSAGWEQWPAAWVGLEGTVQTAHAPLLKTLKPVLVTASDDQTVRLGPEANQRLWALVSQDDAASSRWKVLDPMFWPFIGIVGWSSSTPDMLQLAAWSIDTLPWQVDDAWRQLLSATAEVKANRRRHVA